MKKLFKKNQIIITALALMIAAAGYLSYTHSSLGDDGLTQTSAGLTEEDYDIVYDETLTDAEIFAEAESTHQDPAKRPEQMVLTWILIGGYVHSCLVIMSLRG